MNTYDDYRLAYPPEWDETEEDEADEAYQEALRRADEEYDRISELMYM